MNRFHFAIVTTALLSGCSGMVASNDGERVVIEHDGFVSLASAHEPATAACIQNGKNSAVYLRSANKNPRLAPGSGVQLSTFQCE